jgi:hypothetical protein
MGQQVIIEGADAALVSRTLADAGLDGEVFTLGDGRAGLSIPSRQIATVGEALVAQVLGTFDYIDLWSGERSGRRQGR